MIFTSNSCLSIFFASFQNGFIRKKAKSVNFHVIRPNLDNFLFEQKQIQKPYLFESKRKVLSKIDPQNVAPSLERNRRQLGKCEFSNA